VVLIDGYPRPGGQYFKQLPGPFGSDDHTPHQMQAETMFRQLAKANVCLLIDTLVWDAFPASDAREWYLALHGPGAPDHLQAKALILATGAYDRPIVFPGWTLPGVMTAGAAQILLETQRVLPGRRILLSGTGPLQLAVAAQLVRAGAEVVGVLEGAPIGLRSVRYAPAMWGQWARLREGWDYWRTLRRAGVPLRFGWSVVEARGNGEVEEAVIARLDGDWRPIPTSRQTVVVDTLVIGYGFIPSTELSRLLGCQLDFVPEQGGYVPRRDDEMQTSLPGVYAVGDGAGIGGAELSRVEGRIAGLAVARKLGRLDEEAARAAITRQRPILARERRFARMLGDLFTAGPGLYTLARDDTLICRCEEVTRDEILKAIADGCHTVTWVKRMTRAGMGLCQGRICGHLVARLIAEQTGQDLGQVVPDTVRPPVRPIPLSILEKRDGQ
jgi:NADPH-dependent 2,4-dienoyl-CoA reductase/sulfur reductase-like enzyme